MAYTAAVRRQGVRLEPDEVRVRFQTHFNSDAIHAEQGVLSTDEATERRRWRKIVFDVLPEIPDPDRAFDELWDHFSRSECWRCFPDVAPALEMLRNMGSPSASARTSIGDCVASCRVCPSWTPGSIRW